MNTPMNTPAQYTPPPAPYSPPPPTTPLAIISLVSGILCWIIVPILGAIAAVICGHIARSEIRRAPPGTLGGDGLAIGGLILGYLHLVLVGLFIVAVFGLLGGLAYFSTSH